MKKNEAIKKINSEVKGKTLTSHNTHWANLSEYGSHEGWWLNIPFNKFSKELNLILNNKNSQQFFYISIPQNSIVNPVAVFRNKDDTADIFIAAVNRDNLSINESMIDIQSNGTKHDFSVYEIAVIEYQSRLFPDEVNNSYFEGARKTITVNLYERNSKARNKCIEEHGVNCVVCGFNFKDFYGDRGKGFIHVHHLIAINEIDSEYEVDPINDLRPVCPNCHAMLHTKGNISIEKLMSEIKSNKTH